MADQKRLPCAELDRYPDGAHWAELDQALAAALCTLDRKIVVLDDDPTGVQTVHGIHVYTHWDRQTMEEAFREENTMFFVLTNSRGMTQPETKDCHEEIARNLVYASRQTGRDFILISRSDSTLRVILTSSLGGCIIINPILQMIKLRLGSSKHITQGHSVQEMGLKPRSIRIQSLCS